MALSPTSSHGAGPLVSFVAYNSTPIDIHAIGQYFPTFDTFADNLWDFNTLPGVPDGSGLVLNFGGAGFTTAEAGVWAMAAQLYLGTAADANVRGEVTCSTSGLSTVPFGPLLVPGGAGTPAKPGTSEVLAASAGNTVNAAIFVYAAASNNPLNAYVTVTLTRLGAPS